ncbi:uncharacterized protein HaLaN_08690 [Haematococcus lacustris]|uniref:Uncharacterized protein n=1 Tax=Haematococcus lacustris TaxID=44745 RepID=A0A699YTG8_HAELA|nr:hypothetical protein QJQ45_016125 [Haematococcus lacustris]GFH12911.1 uncharacterized protein HaLaN_08690 [Haematococcus lacustris]
MGSATIADAQQRLRCGKPNGQEQYQMWRSSLATAVADPEFVERNAGELAGLLTEAVRVYVDYKPLRLLLVTARAAARHSDTFVKALAAAVVKQAGAADGPSRHEAFGLLLLARVALERLGGMGPGAKKAVAKLVEVQAGLAEGLMALGGRLVR